MNYFCTNTYIFTPSVPQWGACVRTDGHPWRRLQRHQRFRAGPAGAERPPSAGRVPTHLHWHPGASRHHGVLSAHRQVCVTTGTQLNSGWTSPPGGSPSQYMNYWKTHKHILHTYSVLLLTRFLSHTEYSVQFKTSSLHLLFLSCLSVSMSFAAGSGSRELLKYNYLFLFFSLFHRFRLVLVLVIICITGKTARFQALNIDDFDESGDRNIGLSWRDVH